MAIERFKKDEIRTDRLELKERETLDWIDPEKELTGKDYGEVFRSIEEDIRRINRGEDPLSWDDFFEEISILKLLLPKERDQTLANLGMTKRVRANIQEKIALQQTRTTPATIGGELLYLALFDPEEAEKYKNKIDGPKHPNLLQELNLELEMHEAGESTILDPGFVATILAEIFLAFPEKKSLLSNPKAFSILNQVVEKERKEASTQKLLDWITHLGGLRILFPERTRTTSKVEVEIIRKALSDVREKGRGGITTTTFVFWAAAATAGKIHVEKGRVTFEPPIKEEPTAEKPPLARAF